MMVRFKQKHVTKKIYKLCLTEDLWFTFRWVYNTTECVMLS